MSDELPPEFDISKVGIGELSGILTVGDALDHLSPYYAPNTIRVVWTEFADEDDFGDGAGMDVPLDMSIEDMRHNVANGYVKIRLETGGGDALAKAPELV